MMYLRIGPLGFVGLLLASLSSGQDIVVQIRDKVPEDSYLTWTPSPARIALRNPGDSDVTVTLLSSVPAPGDRTGQLIFSERSAGQSAVSASDFNGKDNLSIELPKDASWVPFFVAGEYGHPSANPGDVRIRVQGSSGEIDSFPTMVRVRKNADKLSAAERKRLLTALAELHDMDHNNDTSQYAKYPIVHGAGMHMAHRGEAFLAWHRAFVLALERELQAIDGSVTLPYWKFEDESKTIFKGSFMGEFVSGLLGDRIRFEPDNPIDGWSMKNLGSLSLQRPSDHDSGAVSGDAVSVDPLQDLIRDHQDYRSFFDAIEWQHHASAHRELSGWLASRFSPADPVFFLLHSNIDRAWARWQHEKKTFDSSDETSYWPQGKWEDSDRSKPKGLYVEDTLWPWDGDTSSEAGRLPLSDIIWKGFTQPNVILYPQVSGHGPTGAPRISAMIDYLDTAGDGDSLGFCYDDVPFSP